MRSVCGDINTAKSCVNPSPALSTSPNYPRDQITPPHLETPRPVCEEPLNPVVDYSIFGLMVTSWIVSACVTAKVWSSRFKGELGEIVGSRYMIPFVGAWACTLALWGYLIFLVD